MHRRRARAEHLHPVHADVSLPGARVAGDHGRQGDERRRVERPARLDRQGAEVDLVAAQHDLLAGALPHGVRPRVGDRLQLLEAAELVDEARGRLHLEDVGELRPDVVEPLDAEGEAHAPLRAELVDQERVAAAPGPLEEERRAAGLDGAVDDLGHLEVRVDLGGDADELALALEEGDPLAQVCGGRHLVGAGRRALRRCDAAFASSPRPITAEEDEPDDEHRRR